MRDDFCAFILTHGRPDRVITLRTLKRLGYTGRVYLVIDDEDPSGPEYRAKYGGSVLEFSKDQVAEYTDQFDNFTDRRAILWARNACWELAARVGCRYFIQLDDDYSNFHFRRSGKRDGSRHESYHGWVMKSLDNVLEALVQFLESTPTTTVCMSQGGDHFGGSAGNTAVRLKRKAMNSFICEAERPFYFRGRVNEDVNTYVSLGNIGRLFFTYMPVQLDQLPSQTNEGGMTGLYQDSGTYVKSFYTVMAAPSCATIRTMGRNRRRLHHHINWTHAVPKIVAETHRKATP